MRFQGCLQYGSILLPAYWGHDHTTEPGLSLRHWVHFQGVHFLLDLLSWYPEELKTVPTQQAFSMDDQGQYLDVWAHNLYETYI